MCSAMTNNPKIPELKKRLQNVISQSPKPNGKSPPSGVDRGDVPLDPRITTMVDFLDRAIRTQDPTVGVVVAAVGVLLGRKVLSTDHLERMVNDLTMATRVGFYLSRKEK